MAKITFKTSYFLTSAFNVKHIKEYWFFFIFKMYNYISIQYTHFILAYHILCVYFINTYVFNILSKGHF